MLVTRRRRAGSGGRRRHGEDPVEQNITMPFDEFWSWLLAHPNCILRAGTPDSVLYDDDDLHWHLTTEDSNTLLVQILRGKRLLGELLVDPEQISYVQIAPPERPDEHLFELMVENEQERFPAYHFVLIHGLDEQDGSFSPGRVH
jgi:hypothetical protein